ncbi:unnamed protein product [Pleuronectes platessa]|uniref:Uncharacterized protein n=1 Tax=Pleuronectes platessa TaxID=8262 RepID=A0A9N7YMX9_PLEPL|nr:unnamed protein product [Pleuronectes platessa]
MRPSCMQRSGRATEGGRRPTRCLVTARTAGGYSQGYPGRRPQAFLFGRGVRLDCRPCLEENEKGCHGYIGLNGVGRGRGKRRMRKGEAGRGKMKEEVGPLAGLAEPYSARTACSDAVSSRGAEQGRLRGGREGLDSVAGGGQVPKGRVRPSVPMRTRSRDPVRTRSRDPVRTVTFSVCFRSADSNPRVLDLPGPVTQSRAGSTEGNRTRGRAHAVTRPKSRPQTTRGDPGKMFETHSGSTPCSSKHGTFWFLVATGKVDWSPRFLSSGVMHIVNGDWPRSNVSPDRSHDSTTGR